MVVMWLRETERERVEGGLLDKLVLVGLERLGERIADRLLVGRHHLLNLYNKASEEGQA